MARKQRRAQSERREARVHETFVRQVERDPATREAIRQGLEDVRAGRTVPLADLKSHRSKRPPRAR